MTSRGCCGRARGRHRSLWGGDGAGGRGVGAAPLRAGALLVGVVFVLFIAFMATFYGLFGWFANLCMVVNLILMLGVMSLLEATLTLPGMAGLVVTIWGA